VSIFRKESPLHDGAVIIRNNRITAAGCFLSLSENPNLSKSLGTRHRAAIGMSENNNMFVIVVSEETGRISVAQNGNLNSGLSIQRLRKEMESSFSLTKFKEEVAFSAPQTEMNLK
jgi:diadenylate cyclase